MHLWMTVWLLLFTVGSVGAEQPEVPSGYGILAGQVIMEGKPIPDATISIFLVGSGPPPDRGSSRRVPDGLYRAESGRFNIALPPGLYNIGVVSRPDPNRKGPPGEDEKFFFVRDKKGGLREFKVIADRTVDLGRIGGGAPEGFPEIANAFTVEGTVFDEHGKPFSGALVLVRENQQVPRPLFISSRTGSDGKYQLKLPAGPPYYLVARENLAEIGRPVIGSHVGAYVVGSAPVATGAPVISGGDPVTGSVGQVLTGMDIIMRKVPNPEEVKEDIQKKQTASPQAPDKVGGMPQPLTSPEKVGEVLLPMPGQP